METIPFIGEIFAILTNIFFAFSFVLARKIENDVAPIYQNAIRAIFGLIIFYLICVGTGVAFSIFLVTWQLWLTLGLSVIFMVVLGDTLALIAQKKIGPTVTLAITTTSPFFTILFATLFLSHPFSLVLIFSAILVAIGVIIITWSKSSSLDEIQEENEKRQEMNAHKSETYKGIFYSILTAISWAMGTVLIDFSMKEVNQSLNIGLLGSFVALSIRYMFASLILSLAAFPIRKNRTTPSNGQIWVILITSACFSTLIGALLFAEAARIAGAPVVSIIMTSLPLFTIPFSYVINKEKISKHGLLGVLITIFGVIILLVEVS